MRIINKRPHASDCFLSPPVEGSNPWVIDRNRPVIYANKNGSGTATTHSWLRLRCNDPQCTALVLVHHWDLMDFVQEKLK